MKKLTEKAFEFSKTGLFTYVDVLVWLDGSRDSVNGIVKRAILSGEILHMHRGLYCLAGKYNRHILDRNSFANLIYGPSYISMETALSIHGWIPEAVHSVISVSQGRAKTFETPLGVFDYVQVKQRPLYSGVERMETGDKELTFFVAKPLKALADYVASRRLDWTGVAPLEESLRIEAESLDELKSADFDELDGVYKSLRARRFLNGLRKELGK